jgi:tetratricopeptide (TPR) repeat protein
MLILQSVSPVFSQTVKELDPEKWANEFSEKDHEMQESVRQLDSILQHVDSTRTFQFLDELEQAGKAKGYRFHALFNCLKARAIYFKYGYYTFYQDRKPTNLSQIKQQLMKLYSSAIDIAYRSEDDYLVAYLSYAYGSVIVNFGEVGLAVMYSKNGIDLHEKLSDPVLPQEYQFLAELLYKVREYDQCIRYAKKAVSAWPGSADKNKQRYMVNCMNTVALGYHRHDQYDSAFIYYNRALQLAKQINDTIWYGIVSGNIGQLFYAQEKYDTAYTLLNGDYKASKKAGFFDNAGNSLQWAARTNLALGNKAAALTEVREAFQLLKVWPDANYLRNTYYTTTQVFREMHNYDSAFYYNNLYSLINDSLEKVVATSSLSISKARLNDETSRYNIQKLNREKKAELLKRNFVIAGIILISIIAFLFLNSSRIKLHHKQEIANAEVLAAKEKLQLFTENIIEKASMIEKLEKQVHEKLSSHEQQEIITALSSQTILTESDWEKFKTLYGTIYPGFFSKLKTTITDITIAEQRMAALIRLSLTTRQMASLLGISPGSVNKTKQRLRQRLNLPADENVEEFIIKL